MGLPCPLTGCGSFNKLPVGTWLCLSLPLLLSSFIFFQEEFQQSLQECFPSRKTPRDSPG